MHRCPGVYSARATTLSAHIFVNIHWIRWLGLFSIQIRSSFNDMYWEIVITTGYFWQVFSNARRAEQEITSTVLDTVIKPWTTLETRASNMYFVGLMTGKNVQKWSTDAQLWFYLLSTNSSMILVLIDWLNEWFEKTANWTAVLEKLYLPSQMGVNGNLKLEWNVALWPWMRDSF